MKKFYDCDGAVRMTNSAETIKQVCAHLLADRGEDAKNVLQVKYPFSPVKTDKRAYSAKESMEVFVRDGFIDRSSGAALVFSISTWHKAALAHPLPNSDCPFVFRFSSKDIFRPNTLPFSFVEPGYFNRFPLIPFNKHDCFCSVICSSSN